MHPDCRLRSLKRSSTARQKAHDHPRQHIARACRCKPWRSTCALRRVYRPTWLAVAWKSTAIFFAYMVAVSIAIENTSSFLIISD